MLEQPFELTFPKCYYFEFLICHIQLIRTLIRTQFKKICASLNFFISLNLPSLWHFAIQHGRLVSVSTKVPSLIFLNNGAIKIFFTKP
jgi:hypothetical protein